MPVPVSECSVCVCVGLRKYSFFSFGQCESICPREDTVYIYIQTQNRRFLFTYLCLCADTTIFLSKS